MTVPLIDGLLWFGADYNPEQWPESVWDEDVSLMKLAGVTIVTIGVFSWSLLEPEEGTFTFGWLDRIIDKLHQAGIKIDLATATASPPPWVALKYPESLPVTETGVRLSTGSRQQYSPHSVAYRRLASRLVEQLAARYGRHPALAAWHVNNEFGCHVSRCYSDAAEIAFRHWLTAKYETIDRLNRAWGTTFWSQQYGSFTEVMPPRAAPTFRNPTQLLDFDRFSSDAVLDLYRAEVRILRELSPGIPITTNFMGMFKPLDYWKWAAELDFISDDSYPDPSDPDAWMTAAMTRDLMRSLGDGAPWMLMEQSASGVNWRPRNAVKAAGINRLWSVQSVARGADGVMYFQWRQSSAGAEKFHSAMLPHTGSETRIFREVTSLGSELRDLACLAGRRVESSVAIVIDWDSWWAIEQTGLPMRFDYLGTLTAWYRGLLGAGVTVDFVRKTSDLSSYSLVVAPLLVVAAENVLLALDSYVQAGGTLLVSYFTGILDEDLRFHDSFLGPLADTLGVTIEEFAPFGVTGEITTIKGDITGRATLWQEYLHAGTATVLSSFTEGDLAGWPALTRNVRGTGCAWYFATQPDVDLLADVIAAVLADADVTCHLDSPAHGVETVRRGEVTFILNHNSAPVTVALAGRDIEIAGRDYRILR